MSNSKDNSQQQMVNRIFSGVSGWPGGATFESPQQATKSELELALTVLLVDLASSDQNFDTSEYHVIASGLQQIFGTDSAMVKHLISQASNVLKNLRGTSRYGSLLKDNMSPEQKVAILDLVNKVIHADGVEDGFEIYLRNKITTVLGLEIPKAEN